MQVFVEGLAVQGLYNVENLFGVLFVRNQLLHMAKSGKRPNLGGDPIWVDEYRCHIEVSVDDSIPHSAVSNNDAGVSQIIADA